MAYVIQDEVLAPKGAEIIEYYGPDPFRIYSKIGGLLQDIFQARGLHIFEDEFRWNTTTDPRPFFFIIRLEKGIDKFTDGIVKLKVFGAQPSDPTKNGRLLIEIAGVIKTTYPVKTWWHRLIIEPFIWIYHHAIYNKVRREYIRIYKQGIERLQAELRAMLGLVMHERLR